MNCCRALWTAISAKNPTRETPPLSDRGTAGRATPHDRRHIRGHTHTRACLSALDRCPPQSRSPRGILNDKKHALFGLSRVLRTAL
eukprot:1645834-Prymnesium_polylepis.1